MKGLQIQRRATGALSCHSPLTVPGLQVWGRRWRYDEPPREAWSVVEGQTDAVAVSVETPSRAVAVRTRHGVSDQRARACADHAARDGAAGAPARNRGSDQRARAC